MDITSTKSSGTFDVTNTPSLSAKLKRLQIEESLLLQSLSKCVPDKFSVDKAEGTSYPTDDYHAFLGKTKNSYREIKLLFQDLKTNTSSQEILKALDIDEVKKCTLELENRIKTFKLYLHSELAALKSAELQLNQTINENPVNTGNRLKRLPKIQKAKYNEIVPSPVKTLMTSPFKCIEVQQFQDFMMNSANRYGGWDEYHHNIFVNQWQKYFGSQTNISFDAMENLVEIPQAFQSFLQDLLSKLQDIREDEIISHVNWYSKYLNLKEKQQQAIDKWRSNRKVMKSAKVTKTELRQILNNKENKRNKRTGSGEAPNYIDINSIDALQLELQYTNPGEVCVITNSYIQDYQQNTLTSEYNHTAKDRKDSSNQTVPQYQKSTIQWRNKMSKDTNTEAIDNNLENIKKLRIPAWRAGL